MKIDFESQIYSILFGTVNEAIARDDFGIPNPMPGKTLAELKKVKKPLENGWTFEEIYAALKPTIISLSKKYATPTFSAAEGASMAYEAISDAIKNDKGIQNFANYVYGYLSTKIRREASRASNLSGVPYTTGGQEDYLAGAKASVSADVPLDDKGSTAVSNIASPEGRKMTDQERSRKIIEILIDMPSIDLTDAEKLILRAMIGDEDEGRAPKTVGEIAAEQGISPARISQVRAKAFAKIQEFLQANKWNDPLLASRGLGLEHKVKAIAGIWLNLIKEAIFMELQVVNEEINIESYRDLMKSMVVMEGMSIIDSVDN